MQIVTERRHCADEDCDSEHIGEVEKALTRIDELVENTLSMARLGPDALDFGPLQFGLVANPAWETAVDGDATLELDDIGTVVADESALQQLLENLFANAAEHGRPADGDFVVHIGRLADDDGFFVADNGPGILPDTQDEIFERGYSTRSEGTGFGLSIVSQIVDAHDWEITATDAEGGGAHFEIRGSMLS